MHIVIGPWLWSIGRQTQMTSPLITFCYSCKTNRFHVIVVLFSNRSQKTLKCGMDSSVSFSPHFDSRSVIYYWTDALQQEIYLITRHNYNYIFSPFIACLQCPWKLITFFFHTGHFNFEFFFSLYTFDVVLHFPLCFLHTFLQCFHFAVNKVADTTELTNCVIFWHLPDFCREGVLGNESFHHSAEKKVPIWTRSCLISARTYSK